MAISPLSFPTILPPYGIATVLLIMIVGKRVGTDVLLILAIVVGYMVLNFICMLSARWILKVFKPELMNVLGIVLSVIQLGNWDNMGLWRNRADGHVNPEDDRFIKILG